MTQKHVCSSGFFSFTHYKQFLLHSDAPSLDKQMNNVSSLLKSWHFYKQHGQYVPLFPCDFGHLDSTYGLMEYPSGGERIHNSGKKNFMATVLAWQRISVLDELKLSMLLLCDMHSVRESNQVWQHQASSRGPAGRVSVSACTCVCVYVCMCPQHTHAHSH